MSSDTSVVGFIDVHTYSEDIIPPGCNHKTMTELNQQRTQKVGSEMATRMNAVDNKSYKYQTCGQALGYTFGGGAGDWAHFDGKVPYSLSIELRSHKNRYKGGYGFLAPSSVIKPTGNEMLAAIHAMTSQIQDIQAEEQNMQK